MIIDHNEQTIETLLKLYNNILDNTTPLSNDGIAGMLLDKIVKGSSAIEIDRYFGIEVVYGISLSFSTRADTLLIKVTENEYSTGYLAVSWSGDIGLIYTSKTNNTSSVILVSRNEQAGSLITAMSYFLSCRDNPIQYPEMSLNDINEVFHARTGHQCVIKFCHRIYNLERIANKYNMANYSEEIANSHISNYILNNSFLSVNFKGGDVLDEDTIKYCHTIQTFLNAVITKATRIKQKTKEAVMDCLTPHPAPYRGVNSIPHISPARLGVLRSAGLNKTIRQMKIVDFPVHTPDRDYITRAHILIFKKGDCFVYNDNRLVGKYSKDEPMDKLDGIINDEYAFQLLEWRYVGQTTIIEPTPQ